ncbi:hypothetical protein QYF36_021552 [Acer negundo]|nr:hypothetical protein QYF36_021552 [Acer negundo]
MRIEEGYNLISELEKGIEGNKSPTASSKSTAAPPSRFQHRRVVDGKNQTKSNPTFPPLSPPLQVHNPLLLCHIHCLLQGPASHRVEEIDTGLPSASTLGLLTISKPNFHVKEKILILIETWQEAFGGPRARYPQYYAAYQELLGAVFPQRTERSAPVFTPPQTQPLTSYPQNIQNLDNQQEAAESSAEAEFPTLSLTEIQNARGIMDVLVEMLSAINPSNKEKLKGVEGLLKCHDTTKITLNSRLWRVKE